MKRIAITVGVAVAVAVLAGCGGTTSSGSSAPSGGSALSRPGAAGPAVGTAPAAPARPGSSSSTDGTAGLVLAPASVIRTADLHVTVTGADQIAAQADRAGQIAIAAGGAVSSDDRTSGPAAGASLTLEVPPPALGSVITKLSALGREVSRQSSARDVTSQVADVGSRVTSAQQSIDRLRALYGDATKVSDIIAIESELAQREADLESLQAQQRALSAQTSMATVTLNLTVAGAVAPAERTGGFLGGLERGWHAFTSSAAAVAAGFGAALPFLLLVAVLAAGAFTVRRRLRPARRAPVPPVDPA
jgi:hypothetical protein